MENTYSKVQELLHLKADYQARLNLIPYEGTPEVKDRDGQNIFMFASVSAAV